MQTFEGVSVDDMTPEQRRQAGEKALELLASYQSGRVRDLEIIESLKRQADQLRVALSNERAYANAVLNQLEACRGTLMGIQERVASAMARTIVPDRA